MSEVEIKMISEALARSAFRFSGVRDPIMDHLLYRDLGLSGSDFIDFIEAVEEQYQVDLQAVSRRESSAPAPDVSLGDILELILSQREISGTNTRDDF